MTTIQWHPVDSQKEHATQPLLHNGWTIGDPWFGVAMGLFGFIVGFLLRTYVIAL